MNNHIFRERESLTSTSKKIISILAVALMVTVVLCAVDTEAANNVKDGTIELGTAEVNVQEYCSEGTATYEYKNNVGTLTLTNAKIVINNPTSKTVGGNNYLASVFATEELVIVVNGSNTIENTKFSETNNDYIDGLYCSKKLTIKSGDATKECSLTVTAENAKGDSNCAIGSNDAIEIKDNVIVTTKSGDATQNHTYSISTNNQLKINNATLYTYCKDSTSAAYGIDSASTVIENSCVQIEVGRAGSNTYGISAGSGCTITNSKVEITIKGPANWSNGINANNGCTITSSEVKISLNNSANISYGIYAYNGFNVTGSEVEISIEASNTVYGVYVNNCSIDDSALKITTNDRAFSSNQQRSNFVDVNYIYGIKKTAETEEKINGDVTTDYKSLYTCVTRDVTYDTAGGSEIAGQKADTYLKFNLASAPSKDGSTFKGWMDEKGDIYQAGAEYTMPGHSTKFTAVWEGSEHSSESFWDTPGNIAGVAVISLLILLFLGLIIWDRKNHN